MSNVAKLNDGERREAAKIAADAQAALGVAASNKAAAWLADDMLNALDEAFMGGTSSPEYLIGCMAQATPKPTMICIFPPSWYCNLWDGQAPSIKRSSEYTVGIHGATADDEYVHVSAHHEDVGEACREALKDWRRQHAIAKAVHQIKKDITAAEDAVDPRSGGAM